MMGNEFEIIAEVELPATPEQVWQATTVDLGAWLFPVDTELGETVVSDYPTHHINRMEGEGGWFNQIEQTIAPLPDGRSVLRWVHSGIFMDDWENQLAGATQHTDFYLHTLGEYLAHFRGTPVVFVQVSAPEDSTAPQSFKRVRAALGLSPTTAVGDTVSAVLPGGVTSATVDFSSAVFVGLRTKDALYRFFGRDAFGAPVGLAVHHFGGADADQLQHLWQQWLDRVFARHGG